jgi:hypothetical protein
VIGQQDAKVALASVERTRRRSIELSHYAHAGNIVLAWGLVWLVCNLMTHFLPPWGINSWPVGIVLATAFCIVHGSRRPRTGDAGDWRVYASVGTVIAAFVLVTLVAGVSDPRQTNAIISLYIAANYVALGIWTGPRYAWTGLFIAAVVMVAWFADRDHFHVWMGLGGGGALILSGLWLRRA